MQKRILLLVAVALAFAAWAAIRFGTDRAAKGSPWSDLSPGWREAIPAIAGAESYGGLRIPAQRDLEPLATDPASGLWEFWHVPSGARPERDTASGVLLPAPGTGITFVLIPGGTFTMGAQKDDPQGRNYDPDAEPDESPLRQVTLAPFFLSKYELTQGQWSRLGGGRPSLYDTANRGGDDHPVEHVTWMDCTRTLHAAGLALPTEAQWEYAARGGTSTRSWCGDDVAMIAAVGSNLLDVSARELPPMRDWDRHVGWDDGHVVHAPVGSYSPNPFGLYDVMGNVREWCADRYGGYDHPVREGDGLRMVAAEIGGKDADRVIRGGCFRFGMRPTRSAVRLGMFPAHEGAPLGVRAARVLEQALPPHGTGD